MTWGLWLCNPRIDFTLEAYAVLAMMAPQHAWGGTIAALGLVQMIALYRENRKWRKYVLCAQLTIWLLVAFGLGIRNFYSTALTTYFWIAILHGVFWLRLAGSDE